MLYLKKSNLGKLFQCFRPKLEVSKTESAKATMQFCSQTWSDINFKPSRHHTQISLDTRFTQVVIYRLNKNLNVTSFKAICSDKKPFFPQVAVRHHQRASCIPEKQRTGNQRKREFNTCWHLPSLANVVKHIGNVSNKLCRQIVLTLKALPAWQKKDNVLSIGPVISNQYLLKNEPLLLILIRTLIKDTHGVLWIFFFI